MADKDRIIPFTDQINRRDLEAILEVNKKAVEIETEVADQNEEIIDLLDQTKNKLENIDDKLDRLLTDSQETSRELFRIRVFFITGILALVGQMIEVFFKK